MGKHDASTGVALGPMLVFISLILFGGGLQTGNWVPFIGFCGGSCLMLPFFEGFAKT